MLLTFIDRLFNLILILVLDINILYIQWWVVGAGGGGATLNIILLVIGIINFQIKYNKMKHDYYYIINNYIY